MAIARALRGVDDDASACVVLDEPTAALPAHDRQRLLDTLRRLAEAGHGVLLVTHHIDELLAVADRVTVLRDGHADPHRTRRRTRPAAADRTDHGRRRGASIASARSSAVSQNGGADVARLVMSSVSSGVAESVSLTRQAR